MAKVYVIAEESSLNNQYSLHVYAGGYRKRGGAWTYINRCGFYFTKSQYRVAPMTWKTEAGAERRLPHVKRLYGEAVIVKVDLV